MSFPCLLPTQSRAAAVHAVSRSHSFAAHTALCYKVMGRLYPLPSLSPLLLFHLVSPASSSGHRRKWSFLSKKNFLLLVFPSLQRSGANNFFLLAEGDNSQAFQRERKKLTKVEEGIQWTCNSKWGAPAGNWEPIRIHGRRELMLLSNTPRKLINPLSDVALNPSTALQKVLAVN